MSTEENKEVLRRLVDCWNQGNLALIEEVFAPDFISPHFVWLAHAFGFGYDAVVGAPAGQGHFRIDLDELRAVITRTVTHIEERGVAPTRGEKSTGCPPHFEGRGACVPRTPGGGNARGMY